MKLPHSHNNYGPSPGFMFASALLIGFMAGVTVSGIMLSLVELEVCAVHTAEPSCCAYKGRNSQCLPCRPTRDVA